MRQIVIVFLISILTLSGICRADYDAAMEARETAQRQAAQAEAAKQKAKADAMGRAAQLKAERAYIGAAAAGKTDAEVHQLYAAKVKVDQVRAINMAQNAKQLQAENLKIAEDTKQQREAGVKNITGRSLDEISRMSDSELDAMANELQKKYGGE